ncbi:helix-turn-helix domain-containing protein [Streptomyces sp. NPDC048669]|uniref:PucR family transcriptional regulator n=1 Tax=Streptomyces sp. NPDC048669 TaxID=3155267 RepID=UPI0034279A5D
MNGLLTQHLHELVQSLAASLDVPVELTDLHLTRVARSVPTGSSDDSRAEPVSPRHLGLSTRAVTLICEPVYIGGSVDLGIPSTLVMPLSSPGSAPALLLWITCSRGPLSSDRVASVSRIAEATVLSLETAGLLVSPEWADDEYGRAFATGDLAALDVLLGQAIREGRLQHDEAFVCLALSVPGAIGAASSVPAAHQRLAILTNRVAETHPRNRCLIASSGSVSFVLLAPHPRDVHPALPELLATKAADLVFRSRPQGADEVPWLVAASTVVSGRASTAVWQARQSLDLGDSLGWRQQVIRWDRAGHMAGLAAVPTNILVHHFVSPSLRWLLEDESATPLVETLRAYLTAAGNVKQVATDLYLHRATVYHRIRKVEGRLGLDLFSGYGRLEVHAGLLASDIIASRLAVGGDDADTAKR